MIRAWSHTLRIFFFLLVNRGKKCFSLKERWPKYPMVNYSQWFVTKRSEYISLFSVHILSVCKSFGIFLMFLFPWYDTMLKKRKYLHQLVSLLSRPLTTWTLKKKCSNLCVLLIIYIPVCSYLFFRLKLTLIFLIWRM